MAKITKELIIARSREYLKDIHCKKPVSLSSLLKAIGVSKGVFYYYFKDKDELFYAIIIPDIKQKESEISKKISAFSTLKERLHCIFEVFTNKKLDSKLNEIENFYLYFINNAEKSKLFATIYDNIKKSRKSLILQQIRYYNIPLTRDMITLIDYIEDTMMLYNIFHKKLKGKTPRREISAFVDMLCRMIESEKVRKK